MSDEEKYSVLGSGRAGDMLLEYARFLAEVSIKAAYGLFDQFEKKVASLEEMPERCPAYDNPYIRPGKYRKLTLGKHLLIHFQVKGNTVYIELIIDSRAENKDLL